MIGSAEWEEDVSRGKSKRELKRMIDMLKYGRFSAFFFCNGCFSKHVQWASQEGNAEPILLGLG